MILATSNSIAIPYSLFLYSNLAFQIDIMPFGRKRTGGYGAGKRKRLQNLQLARDKKISRDESVATTSSATVTTPTRMAGGVSSYACFIYYRCLQNI